MFSSVSGILKQEMTPHLGPIIARMMESLITQEGITVSTVVQGFLRKQLVVENSKFYSLLLSLILSQPTELDEREEALIEGVGGGRVVGEVGFCPSKLHCN